MFLIFLVGDSTGVLGLLQVDQLLADGGCHHLLANDGMFLGIGRVRGVFSATAQIQDQAAAKQGHGQEAEAQGNECFFHEFDSDLMFDVFNTINRRFFQVLLRKWRPKVAGNLRFAIYDLRLPARFVAVLQIVNHQSSIINS